MRRKDPPAAALKHDHDRIHQDAAKKKAPRSSENASANSNKKRASSKDAAVHLWATVDPPGGEPTWHPLIEFVVRSKAPYGVHEGSNHRWTRANTGHAPPGIPATTLRDLYSVPTVGSNRGPAAAAAAAPGRGAGIAVANWQGGACLPYPPDVESYCSLSSFEPYRQGHRVRGSQPCKLEVRTKAARNASAACIEADLDSEMLFAAADMTRSVVGANNGTSFLAWAISWFGQKHGPEIATVSWSGSVRGAARCGVCSVVHVCATHVRASCYWCGVSQCCCCVWRMARAYIRKMVLAFVLVCIYGWYPPFVVDVPPLWLMSSLCPGCVCTVVCWYPPFVPPFVMK